MMRISGMSSTALASTTADGRYSANWRWRSMVARPRTAGVRTVNSSQPTKAMEKNAKLVMAKAEAVAPLSISKKREPTTRELARITASLV